MHLLALVAFPALVAAAQSTFWTPAVTDTFIYAINDPNVPANAKTNSGLSLATINIYDIDLIDTSASTIARYKADGKRVVCYFSAGSYEPWRSDVGGLDPSCYCNKGSKCKMSGWDEWWLNIHSTTCQASVQKLMRTRIALAKSKGCDGVDPDNVDSYTNAGGGHGNTEADEWAYLQFLANEAHAQGLAIGLKNAGDLVKKYGKTITSLFDLSIVEQCVEYNECQAYQPFIAAGKPVYDLEYENKINCSSVAGLHGLQYDDSYDLTYKRLSKTCGPASSSVPPVLNQPTTRPSSTTRRTSSQRATSTHQSSSTTRQTSRA